MIKLKFRAWNKEWGKMIYSSNNELCEKREWYPFCFEIGFSHYPHNLENTIIMQYTGLHDKNGKEIYEGDIIKDLEWDNGNYLIGVVKWDDDRYVVCGRGIKQTSDHIRESYNFCFSEKHFSVIGNIHENPELLEKKQ